MKHICNILLLCLFLFPSYAVAQDTVVAVPTNAELAARIDSLQAKTSTWAKIVENLPKFSGFIQLGYEWSDTSSDFFIKRARLIFAGDIVRNKLDYFFQVEFTSPKIVDAYLRYKPFGGLNFQLGEYKVPFLIENTDYGPLKLEFLTYPIVACKLIASGGFCGVDGTTDRDLGASVYGGFVKRDGYYVINYDFGVFNGEGMNLRDKNTSKDVVGRLTFKPIRNLQVSGSYYWGEAGKDYMKRIRYGAGFAYDGRLGVLRGEYIRGVTGTAHGDMTSDGWFVVAGWRIVPKLLLAARAEAFTENVDYTDSRQNNYSAALTWQPIKYLRCQLDYTYEYYHANRDANRNVIGLMLSGIF